MTNDAAVAWYYEFGDTGEAGPVTFGGDPGREAIEWAERYGHTLHYLVPATTVAELRAEVQALREILIATTNPDGSPNLLAKQVGAAETYRAAAINANQRADAAERRAEAAEQKLAEVVEAASDFLEAADARDNEEVSTQYPDHEKRLRQYKAAREDLNAILPGPSP